MKINTKLSIVASLIFIASSIVAFENTVGKTAANVHIKNPNDEDATIPFLGEKLLVVFYTDPDNKDVNDPLSDALKSKHFAKEKYLGVGIANCKDTWLPNSVIRYASRQKQAKYPNSVILVDDSYVVSKAWGLGDCDGLGYVIIIGKDSKIKFAKAVKTQAESKAIINTLVPLIEAEVSKN